MRALGAQPCEPPQQVNAEAGCRPSTRPPHSLRAQAEFKNCEFVGNSAQGGAGAVSLQDGAIGLFSKTLFKGNSAGQESVLVGAGQGQACLQPAPALSAGPAAALPPPSSAAPQVPRVVRAPCLPPPAAYGAGGAVYLTSNAGFTECGFQGNSAPSGGAVGVGQSSSGIYFNGCTFNVRAHLAASAIH